MVGVVPVEMEMEYNSNSSSYVDQLFSSDEVKCQNAVIHLRSLLIGSNRQKHRIIEQGIVPRLINLLSESSTSTELRISVAYTICSIAKGIDQHCRALIDCGLVPVLLNVLICNDARLVEACLCCLRTLFSHSSDPPIDLLYADTNIIPHLIALMPLSTANQISVATVLTNACKTREQQSILAAHGAVRALAGLLSSAHADVQLPALKCLAYMVFGNDQVSALVASGSYEGRPLLDNIVILLARNRDVELQLSAARCLAYLHRCGVLAESDHRIIYKTLPCLVRLTKKEELVETRVMAAETLAYMIEVSEELQRIAAISNHLVPTMASFLWWEPDTSSVISRPACRNGQTITVGASATALSSNGSYSHSTSKGDDDSSNSSSPKPSFSSVSDCCGIGGQQTSAGGMSKYQMSQANGRQDRHVVQAKEMKRAAFRVFASLAANDEDIRKRIIETDHLMECLVSALEDASNSKLQMAAIGCLHSLTRSVQLLRTTFQDHPVWRPLMKILQSPGSSVDFLVVVSSTLCNLLLEFSPSKEPIVESGAVDLLCQLTHKYETSLRLNGVWGLMNMAFQADQRIKVQIITTLGSDQIFRLLSDQDIDVVMKTLGLLRNLLSNKSQIDHVMSLYGKQIMQAVVLILESDNVADVKEQAICILANIADGDAARSFIMSNEDVLKKITHYMMHTNCKLQMAAVLCVHNLSLIEEQGSADRQVKLREIGVYKILQQLLTTNDSALFDKVKSALQQFT